MEVRFRAIVAVREYFIGQGFIEVETPAIQLSPGIDRHIQPFQVSISGAFEPEQIKRYLHTSPEFSMKKLLAAGEQKIFQLCHVYRDRENGRLHHPEFTMLEWYRAGETYDILMADVENLVAAAANATGRHELSHRGLTVKTNQKWRRMSVADAFARYTGIDVLACVRDADGHQVEEFIEAARGAGVRCEDDDRWDDVFHRIMLERIEPELAQAQQPTFLRNFPSPVGALARESAKDARVCERVEAYLCGIELANGFSELTDPAEQRRRFLRDQNAYGHLYGEGPPIDEGFLSAVGEMPESAGMALGIDRLAMLLTGAETISDVLWAPVDSTTILAT